MVIIQNNLADVFQRITMVNHNLTSISTDENSQARFDVTRSACQQFVSYLNHKSKYAQKLNLINENLVIYENQILGALGSDIFATNESINTVTHAVDKIQKLLLEVLPPESEEWKFLVETFSIK